MAVKRGEGGRGQEVNGQWPSIFNKNLLPTAPYVYLTHVNVNQVTIDKYRIYRFVINFVSKMCFTQVCAIGFLEKIKS